MRRNEPEPTAVTDPVALLADGEPQRVDEALSPWTRAWAEPAELTLYIQDMDAAARDAWLDAAAGRLASIQEASPHLGGAVDYWEVSPPRKEVERTLGAGSSVTAVFTLTIHYVAPASGA